MGGERQLKKRRVSQIIKKWKGKIHESKYSILVCYGWWPLGRMGKVALKSEVALKSAETFIFNRGSVPLGTRKE